MIPTRVATVLLAMLGAAGSASCIDPIHTDNVTALGGEASGVREGPTHRPGQPCLTCHGGSGPGSPEFSVAGTVYAVRGGAQAVEGVSVVLTDANKETRTLVSNEVGNFYIEASRWAPATPMRVELQYGGKAKVMKSLIGGNGTCAFCHYGADNEATHMPPVFMSDQ